MPEKFNAARRVRNILAKAREQPGNIRTIEMWHYVFDVADPRHMEVDDNNFEILRLLGLLNEQIDRVKSEAAQSGIGEVHYHEPFANIGRVARAMNFEAQWSEHSPNITDEVLRQLGIFADISRVDEQVVPAEDFENLKQDLDAFLTVVMENVADDRLRAFVEKQIRIILQGIREYPIRGEDAIRDGDATLLATFLSNHDVIREHKGEEVIEKTMGFWERWTKLLPLGNFGINVARLLMDVDVDPQKAIEAGSKAIEAGSDVIDKFP